MKATGIVRRIDYLSGVIIGQKVAALNIGGFR